MEIGASGRAIPMGTAEIIGAMTMDRGTIIRAGATEAAMGKVARGQTTAGSAVAISNKVSMVLSGEARVSPADQHHTTKASLHINFFRFHFN